MFIPSALGAWCDALFGRKYLLWRRHCHHLPNGAQRRYHCKIHDYPSVAAASRASHLADPILVNPAFRSKPCFTGSPNPLSFRWAVDLPTPNWLPTSRKERPCAFRFAMCIVLGSAKLPSYKSVRLAQRDTNVTARTPIENPRTSQKAIIPSHPHPARHG
jgi:hypothetical protein